MSYCGMQVHVPLMGLGAAAKIIETAATVWTDGKLVSGVSGVLTGDADLHAGTVVVIVGSGSYKFAVFG